MARKGVQILPSTHTQDTIVSCIDFFDNYAFKVQNEIQDMHWFTFQITILVHITY
jgi:hypothetical protein